MKVKIFVFIFVIVLIIASSCTIYFYNKKPVVTLKEDLVAEINTEVYQNKYIKNIENGYIVSKDKKISTDKLGKKNISITIANKMKNKFKYSFTVIITDTKKPEINGVKDITITAGDKIDLLAKVNATDNSLEAITPKVEGNYDTNKAGTYQIKYVAEDSSGNKTETGFILTVKEKPKPPPKVVVNNYSGADYVNGYPYYIRVNKTNNVVIVYGNENGKYSKVVKVFISSPGVSTPVGTFRTQNKYRWHVLEGPVWGQYSTRITGHYLFHSVPYLKQTKDSLEYWEYNRLGTKRSMGCIRLTVIDAKWIYDNCPLGTTVQIYNGPLNGIKIPSYPKIDTTSPNKGWDPTDPDPLNPWNK